jgi:mycofactocin radical SAM maturase
MSFEYFERGTEAPICLTWELTYACNLACSHCLSSSGRRRPDELSLREIRRLIDEWAGIGVFYVNVGGGEPMVHPHFFDIVEYTTAARIGVSFSTNGTLIDAARARRLAVMEYVDLQVSLDGADAAVNDAIRGTGTYAAARRAMDHLAAAGFEDFKISVVITSQSIPQLDRLGELADHYGARLRLTRLRPSGRGVDVWDALRPTPSQQRTLHHWLLDHPSVLTGDSLFHLNALGEPLPGLSMCGAGRIVCLVDPVGDVYACPFLIHPDFKAGNIRADEGFTGIWRTSALYAEMRKPTTPGGACASCDAFEVCRSGCLAAKVAAGTPLTGPDPECVRNPEPLSPRFEGRPLPVVAGF